MRTHFLHHRLAYRNRYHRPLVARLVADGIFGTRNAWRRWPRPQTGRRHFILIEGGRR
jgi:hypothetical protein